MALLEKIMGAIRGSGPEDVDDQIDASPQAILGMLRQLVHHARVPQNKIMVYEVVRVIPDRIHNPCHAEFPGVVWMDSRGDGTNGRQPISWHKDAFQYSVTEKNQCGNSVPELVLCLAKTRSATESVK